MARNLNPDFQDRLISKNERIARSSGSIKDPSLIPLAEQIAAADRYEESQKLAKYDNKQPEVARYANWSGRLPENS